jgi:hypothetical protein
MENGRTDVVMLSSTTSDEEEPALPKSNLLGLFDLCGESGTKYSSVVHVSQQQTQDPAMASSSSSVAAATICLASTATTTTISQKKDDSATDTQSVPNKEGCLSNNVHSPTSVDELPVLEHLEPTSATAASTDCATAPASRQDEDEKEVIVSSAIVKAAMSVSTEDIATPPELSYVFSNLKDFPLHSLLALNLSQPCINRLAFYGIIHDINKEASGMSKEDGLIFPPHIFASDSAVAFIDEEEWLLTAISSRTEEETQRTLRDQLSQSSTPSSGAAYRLGGSDNFAYACGEKDSKEPPTMTMTTMNIATNEYGDNPNPVVAMNSSSRTQLWKPSRSWWEARSSKNPWIDPQNHVKRWRYLWPLIHYHKFLAKCVKKLKRHGFSDFLDPNASSVVAFLRCEICAVSNHLAACSKFNSDQWLEALEHFSGWNDLSLEAHELVQALVSRQLNVASGHESFTNTNITRLSSPLLRKVQESFVKSLSNNTSPSQPERLTMKEDAENIPSKMKLKGRKYYGAHSSAANIKHPDSLLWQGYQPAPYSQVSSHVPLSRTVLTPYWEYFYTLLYSSTFFTFLDCV